MNDQRIISIIKEGKHDKALDQLYKIYPQIKGFIYKNGGNEEEAKEVFQEALLIFIENVSKSGFELTSALNTYLYSICKYLWYDRKRKLKKLAVVPFQEVELVDEQQDMLEKHQEKEAQFDFLSLILDELGERCKELLTLFYLEKMTMKDIAKTMSFNTDKVAKNQKYKCLERGKKLVKEKQQD